MVTELKTLSLELTTLLGFTVGIGYLGLVAVGYATEGPRYQFRFDLRYPLNSIKRILVGLGIRVAASALSITQLILAPLFEASAQVGEWLTQRGSPESQERYRSRFI
jgi:hypothetical protein